MTEREAWLLLWVLWRSPHLDTCAPYVVINGDSQCAALCCSINVLRNIGTITDKMAVTMKNKINKNLEIFEGFGQENPHFPYLYPLNEDGAKQRAGFCLARAEEL